MSHAVIVGAGIGGVQAAMELRHRGYRGSVLLIGDEQAEPYDRPPLSKEFLKGNADRAGLGLLLASTAMDKDIQLALGIRVEGIDRDAREIRLADGSTRPYDHLVLATGARNRELPVPGADLPGVVGLRTVDDAEELRGLLESATHVVIVGGGFIGLEVAAAARSRGVDATVVEYLPRVMARVLSPEMSAHFERLHREAGVTLMTGAGVAEILADAQERAGGVRLTDGSVIAADAVVVGVGVVPSIVLAESAGLTVSDGVVVDDQLRTSDPSIFAIGDCARFHCQTSQRELRLESVQNAVDQARFVADRIVEDALAGTPRSTAAFYSALPWFWSEQFSGKLQIAGAAPPDADSVVRGDVSSGSFSVCRFDGSVLVAVESVNQAKDHVGARKILAADPEHRRAATREAVADPNIALKTLIGN